MTETEKEKPQINFRRCATCENLAAPNSNSCDKCVRKALKGSVPMNLCVHEQIHRIDPHHNLARCFACDKILVREFGRER